MTASLLVVFYHLVLLIRLIFYLKIEKVANTILLDLTSSKWLKYFIFNFHRILVLVLINCQDDILNYFSVIVCVRHL